MLVIVVRFLSFILNNLPKLLDLYFIGRTILSACLTSINHSLNYGQFHHPYPYSRYGYVTRMEFFPVFRTMGSTTNMGTSVFLWSLLKKASIYRV